MKVNIEVIPHSEMRYNTVGDWWFDKSGEETVLQIRVSKMDKWEHEQLVAFHEYAEALLCYQEGISEESVTIFDKQAEAAFDDPCNTFIDEIQEPGDIPAAPYYRQHQTACGLEHVLASALKVDWCWYEQEMNNLYRPKIEYPTVKVLPEG